MVTIKHRKSNYESHEILIMTKKCGFLFHWYSPLVLRDSYFLIPRFSQKYYILPLYDKNQRSTVVKGNFFLRNKFKLFN
jgi:hypothetical protein